MVRLLKNNNVKFLSRALTLFFEFQQHFTHIKSVNFPNIEPCLYAMWHRHQCCIYGLSNKDSCNVLISRSNDGEVIANAIKDVFGFKIIRGSKGKKGSVEATMQMISALKNGECGAIMVDGPSGPSGVVKDGVIKIAKLSGVPIVPVVWYSDNFNFCKLPSWDKLEVPIFDVRLINLYGKPIYVPADGDDNSDERARIQLQESLNDLVKRSPEEYQKVYWHGLWKKNNELFKK